VVADRKDVERLCGDFQEKGCVRLPSLLEPALLTYVLDSLTLGRWNAYAQEGFDSEHQLEEGPALSLLHFVANWPAFFEVAGGITGCGPFTWFGGRVYRMASNAGHYDSWHNDNTDGRLIAMSVNLSPRRYGGGLFQMRERGSKQLLVEIANTGLGDAILFRISENFLHRVTDVEGEEPKTAFAGWFSATAPSLTDRLRSLAGAQRVT
jgi:hypothetical protein